MTHIVIHVPKTGGTSIRSDLAFAGRRVHQINTLEQARAFSQRDAKAPLPGAVIMGHMPMGAHAFMPPGADYVTFLRRPLDRVVSSYFHVRRHPEHPCARQVADLTVGDYGRFDSNAATRQLGAASFVGPGSLNYWLGEAEETDAGMLDRAKRTLESCVFIGLYEHFIRDFTLLRRRLGLRTWLNLPHEMKGVNRLPLSDIPPADLRRIEAHNAMDLELYDYAVKLVEGRLSGKTRNAFAA